jgi:hypothetical protein
MNICVTLYSTRSTVRIPLNASPATSHALDGLYHLGSYVLSQKALITHAGGWTLTVCFVLLGNTLSKVCQGRQACPSSGSRIHDGEVARGGATHPPNHKALESCIEHLRYPRLDKPVLMFIWPWAALCIILHRGRMVSRSPACQSRHTPASWSTWRHTLSRGSAPGVRTRCPGAQPGAFGQGPAAHVQRELVGGKPGEFKTLATARNGSRNAEGVELPEGGRRRPVVCV